LHFALRSSAPYIFYYSGILSVFPSEYLIYIFICGMCQIQFLRPWKSVKNGVNAEFFHPETWLFSSLHWKLKVCEICTINFVVLTKDNFTSFRKSVKEFCIAVFRKQKNSGYDPLEMLTYTVNHSGKRKAAIKGSLFLSVLFFLILSFEFLEKIHKEFIT